MDLLGDPVAHALLVGAAVTVIAGEFLATAIGRGRDRRRAATGSGRASRQDRGTRLYVALGAYLGIFAAIAIAKVPALRAGADAWWTLGLGIAIALSGAALRDWSIVTLGRYFRRVVTIEPGQRIVRRGPYRVLRHPSYTGLALIFGGFGLAIGSWPGAAVALLAAVAGMLPRIRVEEAALARAFGADYEEYAASTSRLVPGVW